MRGYMIFTVTPLILKNEISFKIKAKEENYLG
jgi:hypothetical protein